MFRKSKTDELLAKLFENSEYNRQRYHDRSALENQRFDGLVELLVEIRDQTRPDPHVELYHNLLREHRELMVTHHELLKTLRTTPLYTHADGPLHFSEEEEEMRGVRMAPGVPNPFEDWRQEEALLKDAYGLAGDIEAG